jgi:hypothetical protein
MGKLFEHHDPEFIKMFVHRVNKDAPLQHCLLCRMQTRWPADFQPCSGEEFQPIPDGVPEVCAS